MSDQLHVELEPDRLQVEPGRPATASVRVVNLAEVVEEYELEVVGLPPGIGRVEPAQLSLLPEQEGRAQVVLDLAGGAPVPAGARVTGVRVASRSRPDNVFVAELPLQVAAVDALTLELAPQTVRAGGSGQLRAGIVNQGNRPVDVALHGTDNEGAVAFSFEPQRVHVPPGGRGSSLVSVEAARPVTGAERHRQLHITAGEAEARATFVQRPMLPTGVLAAAGAVLSLLLVGAIALCADGECFGTPTTQIEQVGSGVEEDEDDGGNAATEQPTEEDTATEEPSPSPSPSPSPTEPTESPSPSPSPADEPGFAQLTQCQASPSDTAPVPEDAVRIEETVGDLDGDDLPDRLTTYGVEASDGTRTYYLRVETAIGFVGTRVLDQASDLANIRPLGAHAVGAGPEVVFVQEDSGVSVILLSLWGLHAEEDEDGCELARVTIPDPTASPLFATGGGVSYGNGLECREAEDDGPTELWVWEAQYSEAEGDLVGRGVGWTWPGSGALTFVEATGADLQPLTDEQIEKAYGLDCEGVRRS